MSRTYFSSVFKTCSGMTVWEYILRKRIDLAIYWLVYSKESITDIAGYCGFNSSSNFNHAFKKVMQQTPSEFRRNTIQN